MPQPKSQTVWIEQVDSALIQLIQSKIIVNDVPIPVKVRKPDEDFKEEMYPCITIYNVSNLFDRFGYDFLSSAVDSDETSLTLEEPKLPYVLPYQIDFWARLQSHMNWMKLQWITEMKRDFILPAVDVSGELSDIYVVQTSRSFVSSDLMSNSQRLFHSILQVDVYTEVQEHVRSVIPGISTVDIKGGLIPR